ncbi:MAG TPA: DUF1330 domain-containing protein [Fimbriimonadaceae bacterium]|nr:DUF1330 domain-containing protein [Fimbriimonadaceae bacterium]
MSAYLVVSYDIDDPEGYSGYVPAVRDLLVKHGAEIVVADFEAVPLEGEKRGVYVVLKFASEEAALARYNDPDYEPVRKIRLDSCSHGNMVIVKEFTVPT